MIRNILSVAAAFALAGIVVAGQEPTYPTPRPLPDPQSPVPPITSPAPAQTPGSQSDMNQTLTGCLTQGSGPDVFILSNARLGTQTRTDPAKTYVVAMTDMASLRTKLNNEVRITGRAEDKVVPAPKPGEKVEEKDLPKLTASIITSVATTCSTAG